MKLVFKPISLLVLLISTFLTWVFCSLIIEDPVQGWVVRSYSIWGDWSAHLTFINAFRERGLAWVTGESPLFLESPFRYPFLSHLFTALFCEGLGVDSISGMKFTSAILIFLLPILLFRFQRKLGLSPLASLYSSTCFLFIGGFQIFDSSLKSTQALTNQFESGSILTQFLVFEFFPQRAFLFAICLLLWLFSVLLSTSSRKKGAAAALVLGFMPLLHLHSFIAVAVFWIGFFMFPKSNAPLLQNRRSVFFYAALTAISGILTIGFLFHTKNQNSLGWTIWLPGWAQNPKAGQEGARALNPFWFWLYNTALFLPLSLTGGFMNRGTPGFRAILFAGFLLFGIALCFSIQPYFYDNLKVFTYAFLFLSPFLGLALERAHQVFLPLALILIGLQCATGVRDLVSFSAGLESTIWFSPEELSFAEEFKRMRGSPNDLVLINPIHNHPIPCLTGNPVVMGYPGWLWSWGISYPALENKVGSILLGQSDAQTLLPSLHAKYIVVNAQERFKNQPINFAFLDSHFKKIRSLGAWTVYSTE